jgi:hypothetical protein
MITPMYTVASCFGREQNAAKANVHTDIPHVAKTAVVTCKRGVSRRVSPGERKGGHTVTRDGAETSDEGDLETTLTDDSRKTRISQIILFEFVTTGTTTVFEGAL